MLKEELVAKIGEFARDCIQITKDLREIRRMICPETDDPLVQMCDRHWDEYRRKAT